MTRIDEFGDMEIRPDEMEEQETRTGDTRGWVGEVLNLIKLGEHTVIDTELNIAIVKETEKAIQLQITEKEEDDDEEYTHTLWMPKSVFTTSELGLEAQTWFTKKNRIPAVKITRFRKEV